jgi:signal transduction histidine kinase
VRRLHRKLYLAVVGTLVVFTLAGAMIWHFFAPREAMWGVQSASGVAALIFEGQPPTAAEVDAMLEALAAQLHADVALFPKDGIIPLATRGRDFEFTAEMVAHEGWQISRRGPVYLRTLGDGRRLVIHPRQRFLVHGLHLGLMLGAIALTLALIIYPITRGITARLERLKTSVRELGEGNLAARVAVEGNDEVAVLARSFNESAARVEQLVSSHKMLLANCSHELRTPLARIRLGLEKLAGVDTPAGAEMARSIAELDALIGEMLLSSRLDAMRRPERQEDVDLLALAAEEGAHFGREPTGEALHVRGDATLLRRMVRNLLDNAQRHGDGATRLEVRGAPGGRVELVVEDQGPGIPAGESGKIFEPFFRMAAAPAADRMAAVPAAERMAAATANERAADSRGTGLGLSIVRQVARAHDGDVVCEAGGKGARFVVSLPAAG